MTTLRGGAGPQWPGYYLPRCRACGHFLPDPPDVHSCEESWEQLEESRAEARMETETIEERQARS